METSLAEILEIIELKRKGYVNGLLHLSSNDAGDYRAAQARIDTLTVIGDFIKKEVEARRKFPTPIAENFTA